MSGQEPMVLLEKSLDAIVLVKLRGNRQIRGKLVGFDNHMNLILIESDEIDPEGETISRGRIVVRGDNVIIIAPAPR
jgi:small nuclear ribonucleoprotein